GKILMLTGLLMMILLGMVALAVDIGWILVARTQLQSASDSGSLAGGTELLPGLGASAYRTPAQVQANAELQAVQYVAQHRAGEAAAAYITPARDVTMGKGYLNTTTGAWKFEWGATPYNAVGVTTRRSSTGTTAGDGPLPLIFGPVLGQSFSDVTVVSAAVILPASGIRIPPGSGLNSGLSPFAYDLETWKKYWRARKYYGDNGMTPEDLQINNDGHLIMDSQDLDESGAMKPLFYELVPQGNSGNMLTRRMFDDKYAVVDPQAGGPDNVVAGQDGVLEMNIYPIASESGNFGTVDIGGLDNSTAELSRQILTGISEEDMVNFQENKFAPQPEAPVVLQGDTGISSGLSLAIEQVLGDCKGIVLYTTVQNPGNNAEYTIVAIVGVRFLDVNFRGSQKTLVIQPCNFKDPAAVPDYEEEIGEETTFFTPLILAR
ncbi:MAG: pilus assembly protein TadG-related protein, partial [Pirellulaceae bacterium]